MERYGSKYNNSNNESESKCWICHSDTCLSSDASSNKINKLISFFGIKYGNANLKFKSDKPFNPCLCKGSLKIIHPKCLNHWVNQKYHSILYNSTDSIPLITCPNCKYPYIWIVKEVNYNNSISQTLKFKSIEGTSLIVLLLVQIIVFIYDLAINSEENTNKKSSIMEISYYLYIGTVLIIICAGGFNIIEYFAKDMKIEIQNRDDFDEIMNEIPDEFEEIKKI